MLYRRALRAHAGLLALCLLGGAPVCGADRQDENKKPSLSLRATPPIAFTPARVRVVAEIRGGADDYQQYYCPTIEWDWGDGTISENSVDCDPYEAGKSEIRRRFSAEHVYRQAGSFKVMFRLKQKTKVVAAIGASIQIRAGLRGELEDF